jgi:hypothetical protein
VSLNKYLESPQIERFKSDLRTVDDIVWTLNQYVVQVFIPILFSCSMLESHAVVLWNLESNLLVARVQGTGISSPCWRSRSRFKRVALTFLSPASYYLCSSDTL